MTGQTAGKARPPSRIGVLIATAFSCAAAASAGAGEARASFTVGATVLARARYTVTAAPADILISDEDIRRGYIEVAEPMRIRISNNSPAGYMLLILPQSGLAASVTVRFPGGEVTLGSDGGEIAEPGEVGPAMTLELTYRFGLDPQITPGRYPWPVQLTVQPL
jgi:hypothetical protein